MALSPNDKKWARMAQGSFEEFLRDYDGPDDIDPAQMYAQYSKLDPDGNYVRRKDKTRRGGGGGSSGTAPTSLGGWAMKGMETQFKDNAGMAPGEFQDLNSVLGIFLDKSTGKPKKGLDMLKDFVSDIGEGIVLNFEQQNDLLMKINEKTGMLGVLSRTFREEITEAYPEAIRLGISFEVLTQAVTELVANSGKFRLLGRNTIEEVAQASIFAESMGEYVALAPLFEEVSLGVYDMTQLTNKAGKDALEVGLNSRTVVKDIGGQLSLLNQYGFRRGVEGMSEMVQKSIEFRMNMGMVTGMADKVWSPEGALEMVSNLQVLGGAIGDLNDPIKLMYMATNDVEGLQDALIGASKSLVTYNNEQGRFEVTGSNLRRAKEMADQFGMSMSELTTTAVASMERTQAASDLMSQGLTMDEKDREFLTNLSQMKEGKMVIEVPQSLQEALGQQTEIALDAMTQEQTDLLLSQRDAFKDMSMKEIAMDQVSMIENINRDVSFITATMRVQAGKLGNDIAGALGYDPLETAIDARNLADKIGTKIDVDLVYDAINKSNPNFNLKHQVLGKVENTRGTSKPVSLTEEKTKESETTSQKQSTDVNIKFSSDVNDDAYRLAVQNSPDMLAKIKNSYFDAFAIK